jgi:hypothetical protein
MHEEEPKKKLQKLIYAIWEAEKLLHAWKTSVICPLNKVGDILNCAKLSWNNISENSL